MKRISVSIALVLFAFALTNCGDASKKISEIKEVVEVAKNVSEAAQDTSVLSKDEIQEKMKNYSLTLTATDKDGKQSTIVESKNEEGYFIKGAKDESLYFDYKKNLFYTLNDEKMEGVAMPLGKDSEGLASLTGASLYLFAFEMYRYLGAKKTGSESVQGRSALTYELEQDGKHIKLWQDKEYGICLKYVITENNQTEKMEISDLNFGNAKINVDLSKYKITDMSSALNDMLKK
jgi:hypothetical protein